ncbi:murein biosynthesis integral membrane protein MurJ [Virgisporangium aurantiacum]|uniref:Membrane protein n=1 Tax=Virgisporangium aurantiacum TaxID=175570 RepID=A0A8J3Z6Q3_9ACTN|nr:lipid II flippase MurJ [Virgisporangium aurantiacum]GIJ55940.1 membrane protein [Virgisporangium aurantiacum]
MTVDTHKGLVRAAVVTVAITLSGSLLGFVRDLLIARYFGADGGTDAFLVSWTVPETAFPLVVEGAMAFLLVPLFSRALADGREPRDVVAATLPRIVVVLSLASIAVVAFAPWIVRLIAPGLADPALAVTCTRLTALTILTFGVAGYVSAALRAKHVFGAPATIHLASNVGILALIWSLHGRFGIVSAAAGVAVGGALMVLAQLPSFLRHVGLPRRISVRGSSLVTLGAFAPLAVYTLSRQAQVFVERFLGSHLEPGTISHLNYAQKIAQLPMLVALLVCTVTFPTLAKNVAAQQISAARKRVEEDLRTVTALIFVAAAYLIVFAPAVIGLLLEHGAFTAADTDATAAIMRVYAFGLFGHAMVGVLCRPFFTGERPLWFPAMAMGAGLAVNAVLAAVAVPHFGGPAIAAANGIGITLTAVLLLIGMRRTVIAVSLGSLGAASARLGVAAAVAAGAGVLCGRVTHGAVAAFSGGVVMLVVFVAAAHLLGEKVRRGN